MVDSSRGRRAGRDEIARYFVENRHVAWVLLVATLVWGAFSYARLPKRKDPYIRLRVAVAVGIWPGAPADRVEELVTKKIEEQVVKSPDVAKVESTSSTGLAYVYVTLREGVELDDIGKAFDDVELRLRGVHDLPPGALPIQFEKDFGDTAALLLTVASPKAGEAELATRARAIEAAVMAARRGEAGRASVVWNYPADLEGAPLRRAASAFAREAVARGLASDLRPLEGPGFAGFDVKSERGRVGADWAAEIDRLARERPRADELHPDVWRPIVVADPARLEAQLGEIAGDAYSHRKLDEFSDVVARRLKGLSTVAKVARAGVLAERVYLEYSQRRLAASGVSPVALAGALVARSAGPPGGTAEASDRTVPIDPSGELRSVDEIGGVLLATTTAGAPVYLRDAVDVVRGYESPPRALVEHAYRDASGRFRRARAVTLSVQLRHGERVGDFDRQVSAELASLRRELPEDLVLEATSDQPRQVDENVSLFLRSLYEAIAIVVVIGLVGFREWRSALVLALSMLVTLAMTFGMMGLLGVDVQTVSLASLILALGLLVDDPVVAADAIRRELDAGRPREVAAWLGPTKLGRAILFATLTNVAAYLPFLLMTGDVGRYVHSLPVVVSCSLVASRIVSMTFVPLLGHALLRPSPRRDGRGGRGVEGAYRRLIGWAVGRRYWVLAGAAVALVAGGLSAFGLRSMFFPADVLPLAYVDLFLPEGATIASTKDAAERADAVVREVAERLGRERPGRGGAPRPLLRSVTSYVGTPAPRFWYSLWPKEQLPNYAQLVLATYDAESTGELLAPLQDALSRALPGALVDVKELEHGPAVAYPVEIHVVGDDVGALRAAAERVRQALRATPLAARVRDNWGPGGFRLRVQTDSARANLSGVSHADVALAAATGFSGAPVGVLREGDRAIPLVARLRADERAEAGDLGALYVAPSGGPGAVPLGQVAALDVEFGPEKIVRRDQRRCITVVAFPAPGALPSEVMAAARPALAEVARGLPPGYRLEIGGAEEKSDKVYAESAYISLVSTLAIWLMLVVQFRHAIKPLIVFASIPFGAVGAVATIVATRQPFGFAATLGITSLIGVIVSHIVVLFDAIEEARERGTPLLEALLDAGATRLRPVAVTVGATVLGLIPLAVHGGTLWVPLCYAQIGGLTVASLATLLLVPLLYVVLVDDVKLITWAPDPHPRPSHATAHAAPLYTPPPAPPPLRPPSVPPPSPAWLSQTLRLPPGFGAPPSGPTPGPTSPQPPSQSRFDA